MTKRTLSGLLATLMMLAATSAHAAYPSNEQPMFGGVTFSPAEKAANDEFVKKALEMKQTKEAAADASVQLGFDYLLKKNDPATAMKRFNQAYLLDPNDGAAYQGMAITLLIRDKDTAGAEKLFARAAQSPRVNPDVFADYGRFLLQNNRPADAVPVLKKGAALDPQYVETNSLLAMALFLSGQKKEACPLAEQWQAKAQPEIADGLKRMLDDPACKK